MYDGRCLCGRARYSSAGPALFSIVCHCRDCQRLSGSGGVPVLGVPLASLRWEGSVLTFHHRGGSGRATTRQSCAHCASLLFGTTAAVPDLATIYVGSLDDPGTFRPDAALFVSQRPDWARLALPLAEFATLPDRD